MFIRQDIETGMGSVLFDFVTEPRIPSLGKIAFPETVHTLSNSCLSICVIVPFPIAQSRKATFTITAQKKVMVKQTYYIFP